MVLQNFKNYWHLIESLKQRSMVLASAAGINFATNVYFLLNLHSVIKTVTNTQTNLNSPKRLSKLIEMSGVSPIIEKKNSNFLGEREEGSDSKSILKNIMKDSPMKVSDSLLQLGCMERRHSVVSSNWQWFKASFDVAARNKNYHQFNKFNSIYSK